MCVSRQNGLSGGWKREACKYQEPKWSAPSASFQVLNNSRLSGLRQNPPFWETGSCRGASGKGSEEIQKLVTGVGYNYWCFIHPKANTYRMRTKIFHKEGYDLQPEARTKH